MNDHHTIITDGGLRLVHIHVPGAAVAITGAVIRCGSRDETNPQDFGLAHFVEHTIFKGTQRRRSWHIINRMEAIGGELNAFTGKEDTVVYAVFPRTGTARAMDLIGDLMAASQFPAAELEKERRVVADEIDSYRDMPADAVYDDFEDLLYAGSGLGHNILGTRKTLTGFDSLRCRNWLTRFYTRAGSTIFYAGASGIDTVARMADKYFSKLLPGEPLPGRIAPTLPPPSFNIVRKIRAHQANTVMGSALPANVDIYALALLTNILGGPGMNSLLNVEMRERRGLVYNVEATTARMCDNTMFSISFGCDADDTDTCTGIVRNRLQQLAETPLSARAIAAAHRQYLGQTLLAGQNMENRIIAAARSVATGRTPLTRAQHTDAVRQVNATRLSAMAAQLQSLSTLTLG